jgi:ribosomal protein L16/L10AE
MNIYLPQQGKKYIPKQKNIPFSIKNKKSFINFGFFSIQAKNFGTVTPRQLEAGRRFLVRNLTRKSRL